MRYLVLPALLSAAVLGACAPMAAHAPETVPQQPGATAPGRLPAVAPDSLDVIAADYVRLILQIGEQEPGYVDAYYGPPAWLEAARATPQTLPQLLGATRDLIRRVTALPQTGLDADSRQRRAYLLAHLAAAEARLLMLSGEKMGFADEAFALFGVRPELRPLESFDPVLARIDALVPGDGPLAERVAAFRGRYVIPRDRLDAVMRAAIAECRARTAARIPLPDNERFTLEFVNAKPWSGYNFYQGDANSLIQINTDLPIFIDRAVDLGCHEGYPGHHVYNLLLERTFVQQKGWVEMSVYPLYSPMSFIAEGSANYGIDLAFPGPERVRFEREVLYPLAGLAPETAEAGGELLGLTRLLARAEYTIADDFLSGRVDRETTLDRLQTYGLVARDRATQRLSFIETYRSYIINYGLGRDTVQAWVERQQVEGGGADPWTGMERLLSSQILPVDIL